MLIYSPELKKVLAFFCIPLCVSTRDIFSSPFGIVYLDAHTYRFVFKFLKSFFSSPFKRRRICSLQNSNPFCKSFSNFFFFSIRSAFQRPTKKSVGHSLCGRLVFARFRSSEVAHYEDHFCACQDFVIKKFLLSFLAQPRSFCCASKSIPAHDNCRELNGGNALALRHQKY